MNRRALPAAVVTVFGLLVVCPAASAVEPGSRPTDTTPTTAPRDPMRDSLVAPMTTPPAATPPVTPTDSTSGAEPSATSTTWNCLNADNWAFPGQGGFPSGLPGECTDPTEPGPLAGLGSGYDDGWGWDGVWAPIRRVLDRWFLSLARAALNPILELLANTVFATPDTQICI